MVLDDEFTANKCVAAAVAAINKDGSDSQERSQGSGASTRDPVLSGHYVKDPIHWARDPFKGTTAEWKGGAGGRRCNALGCNHRAVDCPIAGGIEYCLMHCPAQQSNREGQTSMDEKWSQLAPQAARHCKCEVTSCTKTVGWCLLRKDRRRCRAHALSFVEGSLANVPLEKRAEVREAFHKTTAPRMLVVKSDNECREGYVGPPCKRWGAWCERFYDFPDRERTMREWQDIRRHT